jgi:cytochrome b pre-mRNA-processing protein 3
MPPRLNMRMMRDGQGQVVMEREQSRVNFFSKLFGGQDDRAPLRPLYAAIVARARQPDWYTQAGVPDTIDGRFDMVSAILSLVLVRMEALGEAALTPSARLTELFVSDMDGQLREIGIGDIVVGKHIGKMMGALGGRLGAYRDALSGGEALEAVILRNLYRNEPPSTVELEAAKAGLLKVRQELEGASLVDLLGGKLAAT